MIRCFLLIAILASCSCSAVSPHDNFKNHMEYHVGKKIDSPSSYVARYPQWVGGKTELRNGNVEVEFLQGKTCRVFFEVDKTTNVIIGWRFEGSKKDCQIVP